MTPNIEGLSMPFAHFQKHNFTQKTKNKKNREDLHPLFGQNGIPKTQKKRKEHHLLTSFFMVNFRIRFLINSEALVGAKSRAVSAVHAPFHMVITRED